MSFFNIPPDTADSTSNIETQQKAPTSVQEAKAQARARKEARNGLTSKQYMQLPQAKGVQLSDYSKQLITEVQEKLKSKGLSASRRDVSEAMLCYCVGINTTANPKLGLICQLLPAIVGSMKSP